MAPLIPILAIAGLGALLFAGTSKAEPAKTPGKAPAKTPGKAPAAAAPPKAPPKAPAAAPPVAAPTGVGTTQAVDALGQLVKSTIAIGNRDAMLALAKRLEVAGLPTPAAILREAASKLPASPVTTSASSGAAAGAASSARAAGQQSAGQPQPEAPRPVVSIAAPPLSTLPDLPLVVQPTPVQIPGVTGPITVPVPVAVAVPQVAAPQAPARMVDAQVVAFLSQPLKRLLQQGVKGSDVQAWQKFLISRGANIKADQDFGPMTKSATQVYQAASGLAPDGRVGPLTHNTARGQYAFSGDAAEELYQAPDPRKVLAQRVAAHLASTTKGQENRQLISAYQAQESVPNASGFYNSATAKTFIRYGIVPPVPPFYWPMKPADRKKVIDDYVAALDWQARKDKPRAAEWQGAAQAALFSKN